MLHNDYGHQGLDKTLALVRDRFYWGTMNQDVTEYVTNCHWCSVVKGHYTGPQAQQGLHLLSVIPWTCCVLISKKLTHQEMLRKICWCWLTDAFTEFSQAFVINNQKALTIAKILVNKCFYICGILACIHSDKGQSFESAVISQLYSMYNIKQSMTMPYNLHGNSYCERFNHTLLGLLQTLPEE